MQVTELFRRIRTSLSRHYQIVGDVLRPAGGAAGRAPPRGVRPWWQRIARPFPRRFAGAALRFPGFMNFGAEDLGLHRQYAASNQTGAIVSMEKSQPRMALSEHVLQFLLSQNHARR